jgi:hypothetical protein
LVAFLFLAFIATTTAALESRTICEQTITSNSYTGSFPAWLDGTAEIYGKDFSGNPIIFLGLVSSNAFATNSILNAFGLYGSLFQANSIFNAFGTYGGSFGSNSACNSFATASAVPQIWRSGVFIGYLTKNSFVSGAIDPATLVAALLKQAYGTSLDVSAPSIPAGLTATPVSSTQIDLLWNPSTDNVGVTAYRVYSGGILLGTLGNITSASISGHTAATTYTFTVSACDAAGNCSAQSPVVSTTTPATLTTPGAPTIGTATAGNAGATVSFSVPANNGGAAITGYTVTASPGGLAATGTGSPITVAGLANGTAYTFTVKATNSVGTGPSSAASNAVTPTAPSLSLSPTSLSFPSQTQGSTSASQTVTLTSSGGTASITGITASGDFARSTTCGATLAAGASCTVAVTFAPTTAGTRSGTLSITSSATVSPHTVTLTGTGSTTSVPISLAPGWNLLGNSLNQPLSVTALFSDPAVVSTVWKWENTGSRWLFFTPMLDAAALQTYATSKGYGVLSQVGAGEGYWVNAKLAVELAAQAGQPFVLTGANLTTGWNLVATGQDVSPSAFNRSLSGTPPSPGVVPQNLTSLWAWDNPANGWYFYAPGLEAQGETALTDYITSKGYRDFTQHNRRLGNGAGFWVKRP